MTGSSRPAGGLAQQSLLRTAAHGCCPGVDQPDDDVTDARQKLMQYLPVVFAVFQVFFLTALVIYYIFQTLLRILQQPYVTKKFYPQQDTPLR